MSPRRTRTRFSGHRLSQKVGEFKARDTAADAEIPVPRQRCPFRRLKSLPGQRPRRYFRPCGGRLKLGKGDTPDATCRKCGRVYTIKDGIGLDGHPAKVLKVTAPDASVRRPDTE